MLGIAPRHPSLSDSCLPGSQQENGETDDPVNGDDDIARAGGADCLAGQTCAESAQQQCQQGQVGMASGEVPRWSSTITLCPNRRNNDCYSNRPRL
jgi:hypothetical protein